MCWIVAVLYIWCLEINVDRKVKYKQTNLITVHSFSLFDAATFEAVSSLLGEVSRGRHTEHLRKHLAEFAEHFVRNSLCNGAEQNHDSRHNVAR